MEAVSTPKSAQQEIPPYSDWPPVVLGQAEGSKSSTLEETQTVSPAVVSVEEVLAKEGYIQRERQRQWVLRYKFGNHPATSGLVVASSRDKAEEVGRAWCLKRGAGQMQVVRFIGIENPILADESILGDNP